MVSRDRREYERFLVEVLGRSDKSPKTLKKNVKERLSKRIVFGTGLDLKVAQPLG